jgi:hypothetical protein
MSCKCSEVRNGKLEIISNTLDYAELRPAAEQSFAIPPVMATMIGHLEKAERAQRLGFGSDVVALHRNAAERDRTQVGRQIRAVIARLDERTSRDDWPDLVQEVKREFSLRDGQAIVEESKQRFRFAVLDMGGVSADDAGELVAIHEEALDHVLENGISGATQLLRRGLERGLDALQHPDFGRQPASPLQEITIICITIVVALAAIALAICGFTPLCWCCYGIAIAVGAAVGVAACLTAEL